MKVLITISKRPTTLALMLMTSVHLLATNAHMLSHEEDSPKYLVDKYSTLKVRLPPPFSSCWANIEKLGVCVHELNQPFRSHHIGLGPKCSAAITEVSDTCFQLIFRLPNYAIIFGELVKLNCPHLLSPTPPFWSCWANIEKVGGCVHELNQSFRSHHIGLGPKCCEAITEISDTCFQLIFQLPNYGIIFGELVKLYCAHILSPTPPFWSCWANIEKVGSCVHEHNDPKCYEAITGLSDSCFKLIFRLSKYAVIISDLVKLYSPVSPTPSPPTHSLGGYKNDL